MMVSVIIPVYNRESTVVRSMQSVLSQTWKDLELIVVDDCSRDGTVSAIKSVKDQRIRLICSEKNEGACAARNKGIEAAKGDVIAFQDSDDIWLDDKLEKNLKTLSEEKADFVFSARQIVRRIEGREEVIVSPSYNINNRRDTFQALLGRNCVSTQTIVCRKSLLKKVRFDEKFPRFQDWDFALQTVKAGYRIVYCDEVLVECQESLNAISASPEKGYQAFCMLEEKYSDDYRKYPAAYAEFCAFAGFLLEKEGMSGKMFFKKEYKLHKSVYSFAKYVLAASGLYRIMNPDIRRERKSR